MRLIIMFFVMIVLFSFSAFPEGATVCNCRQLENTNYNPILTNIISNAYLQVDKLYIRGKAKDYVVMYQIEYTKWDTFEHTKWYALESEQNHMQGGEWVWVVKFGHLCADVVGGGAYVVFKDDEKLTVLSAHRTK